MSVCACCTGHTVQGDTRSGVSGKASGESGSVRLETCCAGEDVLKVGLHS